MKIKVIKKPIINEDLEGKWQDRYKDLKKQTLDRTISKKDYAEYQILSQLQFEDEVYTSENGKAGKIYLSKKDLDDKIDDFLSSQIHPQDDFVTKSTKSPDDIRKEVPDSKKQNYQFFRTLQNDKDKVFVKTIHNCLDEITANALYWLLVDFQKAPLYKKYSVVDDALGDYANLTRDSSKNGYYNIRALLREEDYVKKYIEMYKPFAGKRPKSIKTEKPQKINKKQSIKDNNDDTVGQNSEKGDNIADNDDKSISLDKSLNSDDDKENKADKIKITTYDNDYSSEDSGKNKEKNSNKKEKIFLYKGIDKVNKEIASEYTIIRIDRGVSVIQKNAFYGMTNVDKILYDRDNRKGGQLEGLPNTIETVSEGAFYNCSSLENIKLPQSIVDIQKNAFYGCPINSIYIGEHATNISREALSGIQSDTLKVTIDVRSNFYELVNNMINNNKIKEFKDYFLYAPEDLQIYFVGEKQKKKLQRAVNRIIRRGKRRRKS